MKISINAIRAYNERYSCGPDPAPDGATALVERIGAQLAAIETVTPFGTKFAGVVIAKVVECDKHDNSDHLNVCLIDDGNRTQDLERNDQGLIQVVCGAANVRAGLLVAWLPPGVTVPSSFDSDPFVLTVREIRGKVSNGMIASAKELALGDSHEGILEIDGDIEPGTLFSDAYNLNDDVVIDMENKMFTHRPDCFGTLGIAREIAGIQGQQFSSPAWYVADAVIPTATNNQLSLVVRNEVPDLVARFVAICMSDIRVETSPVWLQVELSRLGMRPINNIVDLTNYYMLLTGQPLHAYDYDKVVGQDEAATSATIVVRKPFEHEHLALLNGKVIEPRPEAIVIATATTAIGLGGVMGGRDTEVDASTTNIILECASFDMYSTRRTSMVHGLFSDAVTRFNKGQSPLQNMAVAARIVADISEICGGRVAGPIVDYNGLSEQQIQSHAMHPARSVSTKFINDRLGLALSAQDMIRLLTNVEFVVDHDAASGELRVTAPFWRTDIEISEDIVEEVGRLYGFDKLALNLPNRDIAPASRNQAFMVQSAIRDTLRVSGANELLTYSFVDGKLLDKVGQDRDAAFKLSNALSPELQYYRLSLTPSLLDKVHANIKTGYDEFAIFELGKVYTVHDVDDDSLPVTSSRLALVWATDDKKSAPGYGGAAFYQARSYLMTVLSKFDGAVTLIPTQNALIDNTEVSLAQMLLPYDATRSAVVEIDGQITGVVGEYKPSIRRALKLPIYSAGFEILLSGMNLSTASRYTQQSKFPGTTQDICLRVPAKVNYGTLQALVWQTLQANQPEATTVQLTPQDIYQRPEDTEFTQYTFRISIASHDRTMIVGEVTRLLDTIAASAHKTFGAERV